MSEPTNRGAEFESSLKDSDVTVAAFERRSRGPLDAAQHFLHGAPTMVPVIVLYFFTQRTFIEGISTSGLKG